jgi:hypothetical protein
MAHTTLAVEHGLDLERAQRAARLAADHYLTRFGAKGLQIRWQSDTHAEIEAKLRGSGVRASVEILADTLQISANVPLLLLPFKAVASAAIAREVRHWASQVPPSASA